jgi:LmbE family N-acetylglucosaminyl deacetylase
MAGTGPAAEILAQLSDPARRPIGHRAVVVVAHPDDETIGLGAQLHRFRDLLVVHVTDGAPRRGADADRDGFDGPAAYAAARRAELVAAMELAGLVPGALAGLDVPDQDVAATLPELVAWIRPLLSGANVVFTHAYEGGHPDHDATAFAVGRAAAAMAAPPAVLAMPFYRAGAEGWIWQHFGAVGGVLEIPLAPEEVARKRRMLACFASQAPTLAPVRLDAERFRDAAGETFSILPNGGAVLYERFGWGVTGEDLLRAFKACDAALGRAG